MDPNANLQEQEQLLARKEYFKNLPLTRHPPLREEDVARLRELRATLRVWLTNGGFEPDWAAYPKAARYYRQFHLAGAKS